MFRLAQVTVGIFTSSDEEDGLAGAQLGNSNCLPTAAVTQNDGAGSAFPKAVVSFCSQNIHPPKLVKFPKTFRHLASQKITSSFLIYNMTVAMTYPCIRHRMGIWQQVAEDISSSLAL